MRLQIARTAAELTILIDAHLYPHLLCRQAVLNGNAVLTFHTSLRLSCLLSHRYRKWAESFTGVACLMFAGQVVEGLDLALLGMKVGEAAEIVVQPQLAFGAYSPTATPLKIPADSVLSFSVELLASEEVSLLNQIPTSRVQKTPDRTKGAVGTCDVVPFVV